MVVLPRGKRSRAEPKLYVYSGPVYPS
jgi:hypothetical protein